MKMNGVDVCPVASNAKSAAMLSRNNKKEYGAIVPELAMKKYKLKCLARDIQTSRFNVTRFVVISSEDWAQEQETVYILQNKSLMKQIVDSSRSHK